jgi:hypothetical protein
VAMVTVTAFTVLTAIATIIHLHLFHLTSGGPPARFAAWLWLAVYFLIPAACLAVVVRQERGHRRSEAVHQPIPGWLMALLGAQGAILFLAGVVLYAGGATRHHTPKGWTAFWPLPLAPMTSLAVGAWLIAFGFAAAMALWERDLSRLFVPAVAYTVFGVLQLSVVLWYRTGAEGKGPADRSAGLRRHGPGCSDGDRTRVRGFRCGGRSPSGCGSRRGGGVHVGSRWSRSRCDHVDAG